jgi:predicted transcriptional regulator
MKDKINKTPDKTASGTSILLRLSSAMAAELRRIAKKEERSITTVASRAIRQYFKTEHNIEIANDEE